MQNKLYLYQILQHRTPHNTFAFPYHTNVWAYYEGDYGDYKVDGDTTFYTTLLQALAILYNDPTKILYFPISKPAPVPPLNCEAYNLVLVRPELQFQRHDWKKIRTHLYKQHYIGDFTYSYSSQKMIDEYSTFMKSDRRWKKSPYYEDRKDYVEELYANTLFLVLPKEVYLHFYVRAYEILNHILQDNKRYIDQSDPFYVGIGWIWQYRVLEDRGI